MRFYGMSDQHVLSMPVKRFWLLHKNVDRLRAEEDTRILHVAIHAASGESASALADRLNKQMGVVFDVDEGKAAVTHAERDRAGLMQLKSMGALA